MSKTFKRSDDFAGHANSVKARGKVDKKAASKKKIRNYHLFAVVDEDGEYSFTSAKSWRRDAEQD